MRFPTPFIGLVFWKRVAPSTDRILFFAGRPVVVTAACSGTDYFLIVTALVAWRLARQG